MGWISDNLFGGKEAKAITRAAEVEAEEMRRQAALRRAAGDRSIKRLEPMRERGMEGFDLYSDYLTGDRDFQLNPGYQFALEQGQNALTRRQNATGRMLSGAGARELTRYGQGTAMGFRQQELGNLNNLAGYGERAVYGQNAADTGATQGVNQLMIGSARATANGITNAQAARSQATNNMLSLGGQALGYAMGTPFGGTLNAETGNYDGQRSLGTRLLGYMA